MDAPALLARLRTGGHNLEVREGRLVIAPPPPPDLWSDIREAKASAPAQAAPPATMLPEAAAPAAKAPPRRRRTRPSALPKDPPTPIIDPEATRVLCILELAGAAPRLTPDGTLELARPELVTPETRAAVHEHQDNITAILEYRYLLEGTFPVSAEPPARNRSGHPLLLRGGLRDRHGEPQ